MRKLVLTLTLLLFASTSLAQVADGSGTLPEDNTPEPGIETAECGDGVCQSVIEGSCPQDCKTNETEQNTTTTELIEDNPEIISGVITVFSLSVLTWIIISKRRKSQDIRDELETQINKKLDERKDVDTIRNELQREGYSKEKIDDVIEEILY